MRSHILRIDVDYIFSNRKILKNFYFLFKLIFYNLKKYKNVEIKTIKVFETKKGAHITIELNKELPIIEVLLIQSILGDRTREAFNYTRYLRNDFRRFNFFSRKKIIRDLNGNVLYISEEKETKRSRKLLRRLIKIINLINNDQLKTYETKKLLNR